MKAYTLIAHILLLSSLTILCPKDEPQLRQRHSPAPPENKTIMQKQNPEDPQTTPTFMEDQVEHLSNVCCFLMVLTVLDCLRK